MSVHVINYCMSTILKIKKNVDYRSRQQQMERIGGGMGTGG